jgi:hypothetical protein
MSNPITIKKTKGSFLIFIALTLLLQFNSFSQVKNNLFSNNKKSVVHNQKTELKKITGNFSQTPQNIYSVREAEIMDEMNRLKQMDNNSGEKIVELQKKIEMTNGSSITKQESNSFGTLIPASHYGPETDNINLSYIISQADNYIGSLAVQIEQRGATAGKIWVAVGLANGDTGLFAIPDTIGVYYSVNNGLTYNLYAKIAFSSHNKIEFDDMDMEIIENTTGTKYLHIVFGYTTNGG